MSVRHVSMARDFLKFPPYTEGAINPNRHRDKLVLMLLAEMAGEDGTFESNLGIITARALLNNGELNEPLSTLREIGLLRMTSVNAQKGTFLFEVFPT